ncbi:MAG: prepilin-type N-terminal cleavage/methylation domain-containing protein [Pseudomonadota bacterium]
MTRRATRGFTLIELMVAIAAMAILALMSWRGIDGMVRSQTLNRDRSDGVLTAQAALAQWSADLDATIALTPVSIQPIEWNGRVLRLTRRANDGVQSIAQVVAWTQRSDGAGTSRWYRWQSPALRTRGDWQQAWTRAAAWAQDGGDNGGGTQVALMPLQSWSLLYFINSNWVPAEATSLGATTPIPNGIRLVLDLSPGTSLAGEITRDWIRPTFTPLTPRS